MPTPILQNLLQGTMMAPVKEKALKEHAEREARNALAICGDNVATYLGDRVRDMDFTQDIPNIAPPFPTFWIEYDTSTPGVGTMRVGVLFMAEELDDEQGAPDVTSARLQSMRQDRYLRELRTVEFVRSANPDKEFPQPVIASDEIASSSRWFLQAVLFYGPRNRPVIHDSWWGFIQHDGTIARTTTGVPACFSEGIDLFMGFSGLGKDSDLYFRYLPAFMTIGFMHCKNVVVQSHLPSRQQRRLHERKGEPIVKYHTLVIEPMKKVLQSEGGVAQHGMKRALHICRGHFSTYTEDKPLFGKYAGTFWRPSHVRGSSDTGAVLKDYRVTNPRAA